MFAFASLRLADINVKRVTSLYVWSAFSLLLWGIVKAFGSFATGAIDQKTGMPLLSIVIIGTTLALTPIIIRKIDDWIDAWVFQVPDFNAASERFWKELLELGSGEEVYRAGEAMVRNRLALAAVRIMPLSELYSSGEAIHSFGPNPYFVRPDSPLRPIISPSADFLVPLFHDGEPAHLFALSYGSVRPPLAAKELSFVTRIAGEIQVRISTVLARREKVGTAETGKSLPRRDCRCRTSRSPRPDQPALSLQFSEYNRGFVGCCTREGGKDDASPLRGFPVRSRKYGPAFWIVEGRDRFCQEISGYRGSQV
jgi:hypothetical protein